MFLRGKSSKSSDEFLIVPVGCLPHCSLSRPIARRFFLCLTLDIPCKRQLSEVLRSDPRRFVPVLKQAVLDLNLWF